MSQKLTFIFLLSLITSQTFLSASEKRQKSSCCNLKTLAYKIASTISHMRGRDDYCYLAQTNSIWLLEMKLQENLKDKDLDAYYLSLGYTINVKQIEIYTTPLHEAIQWGNIECVKLLLKHGADKNKRVAIDLRDQRGVYRNHKVLWETESSHTPEATEREILESNYVGLSAHDLAYILTNSRSKFDLVPKKRRNAIYELLIKFNKKQD